MSGGGWERRAGRRLGCFANCNRMEATQALAFRLRRCVDQGLPCSGAAFVWGRMFFAGLACVRWFEGRGVR